MKITKGTPQAMKILEELKKSGDLVDVYSENFFIRQPTYSQDPRAPFIKEAMERIDETESDPDEEQKPKNHLLFIFIDRYKKDIQKELIEVYPPLKTHFKAGHLPDFLLINLYTKQILCVGFGRKNRLFIIDAKTCSGINAFDLYGTSDDSDYMDRFLEHDFYDVTSDFLNALNDLSITMCEYDNLPGSEELVDLALQEKNPNDGLHYIHGGDQGYTTDEINEFIEKYREYQAQEDEAMKIINIFFPQCERAELNTGDYPF